MMTSSSLLLCEANNAGGASPARSLPRSAAGASHAGDFQKLMGQAQAGQKGTDRPSQPDLVQPGSV